MKSKFYNLALVIVFMLLPTYSFPQTRQPLEYYTNNVNKDLFGIRQHNVVKTNEMPKVNNNTKTIKQTTKNPFGEYLYTGVVTYEDSIMCIVEDSKNKEGYFLHIGDYLNGGIVTNITPDTITIFLENTYYIINKNTSYSLVPLNNNAQFLRPSNNIDNTSADSQQRYYMPQINRFNNNFLFRVRQ